MTPPAATAAGRALPRTVAPRAPRRTSGPAPTKRVAQPRTGGWARKSPADPLVVRALRRGRTLADSRLLDRLVRGRLWIPLVAALLMGIVFMQVSMLRLNAGIGRAVDATSTLERENATLRAQVSGMEGGQRIADAASRLGMVVPADGTFHYVTPGGRGAAERAAQRMTSPRTTALATDRLAQATSSQAALQQAVQQPAAATSPAATGAGATATTAATATTTTSPATTTTSPATTTTSPATTQQQSATQTTAPATTQQQQQTSAPATTAAGGAAAPTGGQG